MENIKKFAIGKCRNIGKNIGRIVILSSVVFIITGCLSPNPPSYEDHLNRSFITSLESPYSAVIGQHLVRGADLNEVKISGRTIIPLIYTIKKQNDDGAWFLLKQGADIHSTDSKGWTALMWAIYNYEWELARILVEKGSDVNYKGNDGMTPMDIAVRSLASASFLQFLLDSGAVVTEDSFKWALKRGCEYDVLFLLAEESRKAGYELNSSPLLTSVLLKDLKGVQENYGSANDEVRREALAYAVAGGSLDMLSFFQDQGVDFNLEVNHDTLLATAVYYEQEENVLYLLDQGVGITETAPFYYAVLKNQKNLVERFITDEIRENSHNMLIHAIREADPQMVELLLNAGLEFDNEQKFFPNDILRRDDCISLVEYLLTKGFDLNVSDDYDSLIRYAGFPFVEYETMLWLLENGADPALFDLPVSNPVRLAAKFSQDARKVEALLAGGGVADNAAFIDGVRSGDLAMVRLLVEYGADLTTEFRELRLLTYAAGLGYEHIVEYLAEQGMDVNRIEANGMSPLWVAVTENNLETVEVLLKAGADLNLKNSAGLTALEYAQEKNRYLMTEIIKKYTL